MLALFLVLLIDRLRQLQHVPYALYAVAVVVVSWWVLPEQFLLLSLTRHLDDLDADIP